MIMLRLTYKVPASEELVAITEEVLADSAVGATTPDLTEEDLVW